MYIRRVVIKGFKTYRNETIIDNFSPHHNIVIGSNGSGKSNFFAAIRFVLSNDYANLKREERQGLIHQGTGSVMSASVEIVFHDPSHRIILSSGIPPRENDEVFVRRTVGLKKDDYQLNDRNVTKSDVVRMLESAGFSMSNPYNIVPQGRIVALTNAKDRERLHLLEEVVGAKSFEIKLRASLKNMDETEKKRAQIGQEMEELVGKLKEMEEEQKELERYNGLERNRKVFQFTLYDRELNDVINQIERLDGEYNTTVHSSGDYVNELDQREEMISQVSKELQQLESSLKIKESMELRQSRDKNSELSTELANLNVKITDLESQIQLHDEQVKIDETNLRITNEAIQQNQKQLSKIEPRFQELGKEETEFRLKLAELQERERDLLLKKGKYADFRTKEERDTWIQQEINDLRIKLNNLREIKQQVALERTELRSKLTTIDQQLDELTDSIQGPGALAELNDLDTELNNTKHFYAQKIDERKELWRTEQRLQSLLEATTNDVKRSESEVTETMSRDLASGIKSVKEIAEKLKLPDGCVFGTLGELIKVNDKYKKCAEVVGGNSLFHIVVDTDETASLIIQELYRMKGGRVTFLPLNRVYNDPNITYPPNEQASCTPLIKKIRYDTRFEKAIKQVFGKTIVVRDLSTGARLAKRFKLNAITLDGDRADKKGALTGGYHDQHKKTRLDLLKKLKDSRSQYKSLTSELEDMRQKIQAIDASIDAVNGTTRSLSNKKETILTNMDSWGTKLNNKKTEKIFLEESMQALIVKAEKIETNIRINEEKSSTYLEELSQNFDNELSSAKQEELNNLKSYISDIQNKLDMTSETLYELTNNIDTLNATLNSKLIPQQKELNAKLSETGDSFVAGLKSEVQSMLIVKTTLDEQLELSNQELNGLQEEINNMTEKKKASEKSLEKANSQQASLLKKLEAFQKDAERFMVKKTTLAARREELQQKIREVGLLAEDALNSFNNLSSTELLQRLNSVNEDISGLSNVNKRAFENFKKFGEKKTELEERAEELEESKSSIQNLITRLKRQKINAVDTTFNKVSENFSKVFEKLVPRGTAKLIIHRNTDHQEDPNNDDDVNMSDEDENNDSPSKSVEEMYSGVSISVSFNSKKNEQQHVEQLSGGQKTVCAVALILAIQMVEPAPFYLFDEIDAALDKQYRTAVANTIKELSGNAQFICTTFRSDMLEVADKFYQVKYENKISTVVEVDRKRAIQFIRGSNKFAEM